MLLWAEWKRITSVMVLLSFGSVFLIWLPWTEYHTAPAHAPRNLNLHDDELLRQLNLSSSLFPFSRSCENFLLDGGLNGDATDSEKTPIQGWSGGEWHYSPESDFDWLQQQKILGDGSGGNHEATFSVKQATHSLIQLGFKSVNPTIHAVEGLLVLRNFWNWVLSMDLESEPEIKAAFNRMQTMQNLKIFLKGAFVDTDVNRLLCMTGCAYRNDHSYHIDCGFILKMMYPKGHTATSTRQIQAELSSARIGKKDPLRFPAFHIDVGPNPIVESENQLTVDFLKPALKKKAKVKSLRHTRARTIDPKKLAKFLEDYDDDTYSGYH